jgi:hypothetical protein
MDHFVRPIRNVVELAHRLHDKKAGSGFRSEALALARQA